MRSGTSIERYCVTARVTPASPGDARPVLAHQSNYAGESGVQVAALANHSGEHVSARNRPRVAFALTAPRVEMPLLPGRFL